MQTIAGRKCEVTSTTLLINKTVSIREGKTRGEGLTIARESLVRASDKRGDGAKNGPGRGRDHRRSLGR